MAIIVSALAGYLLGSIPTGYLIGRLWGVDVLKTGSGRTGGTNVLRSAGPIPFFLTFAGDVGKGYVAVVLVRLLFPGPDDWAAAAAALAVVVGHNWSIFLRGRGGAGGASASGALLAIAPIVVPIALGVTIIVILISRYVSLGTILGSITFFFCMLGLAIFAGEPLEHLAWATGVTAFIVFAHRPNIERLLKGTERKLGHPA